MPGTSSFRQFERVVRDAARRSNAYRGLTASQLASAFETFRSTAAVPSTGRPSAELLALVREAANRTLGLDAFDEQLAACCALVTGHAVEMDTGEGKTLVGALAAAMQVGTGRRVHVLSVNDYLAERDAGWMGPFFAALGVSVGWIGQQSSLAERQRIYRSEVVYAPVSEVGFDVLRDRFAVDDAEMVSPVCDVAIVDEADAVMIDEAMVPLVLAGSAEHPADDFAEATRLVDALSAVRDFTVDADGATVSLTDQGLDVLEERLGGINLYAAENIATLTRINLALHARVLVRRDVDYLVIDGVIKLVNTGRGRVAHLQRWPDGLHAAVEAKEGLAVSPPGVVLDTVTVQDLLRSYRMLSGMSGTIRAVANELLEFYSMPAGRIERHRPNRRVDEPDRIVITRAEAFAATIAEVEGRHRVGQPVLVGTQSVAEFEELAARLLDHGITPRVLNARNDADEAGVIARAGEYAAVTISTQISGRGTDIRLGGADERDRDRVVAVGGLAVVAVGRYPSRRLDAQLRGRAARQGDPGTSVTMVSLDDDLVRTNTPDYVLAAIDRDQADVPARRRQQVLDAAQRAAELARLDRHRATWAYNRAIAAQRSAVLARRRAIIDTPLALETVRTLIPSHLSQLERDAPRGSVERAVRAASLYFLDDHWIGHLATLQEIRDGIHLRALIGEKPVEEFHRIALREFHGFFDGVDRDLAEFVAAREPDDLESDPDEFGLRRPSATWTYMVTDDPFGSPGDRLARELGKYWRSRVLRIV